MLESFPTKRMAKGAALAACAALLFVPAVASASSPFNAPKTVAGGDHPEGIATADFNGDSTADVATSNVSGDDASILLGAGAGVLGAPISVGAVSGYENPEAIAVGHFNADSDPDLVLGYFEPGAGVLLGGTGATFGAPTLLGTGNFARSVAVGDFNGDSKDDVVVANLGNPEATTVSVVLGNGDGTFGSPTSFAVGSTPISLAVGDVDGDTNLDIVAANFGSASVSVLLGDGTGDFDAASNFSTGTQPNSVAIDDFNEDQKPDLAIANHGSGDVSLLFGDGDGGFGPPISLGVGSVPQTVAAADFNEDSHVDLVVGGFAGLPGDPSSVSVLMGDGHGGFGLPTVFPLGSGNNWVTIGNFNGDSDPDVAVATEFTSTASVFLNALHAPATPTVTSLNPASPANDNSPTLKGTAASGSTVRLYTTSDCSGSAAATGTAAAYASAGFDVTVPDDSTTTFHATATNTVGVVSDCSTGLTFVEDSTPPDTSIDSGPTTSTNDQTPTFAFSSTESGSSFQCRFDSASFATCSGPGATHTAASDLSEGVHSFEVKATDQAGNTDGSAATRSITIDLHPPSVTINSAPTGTSNQTFAAVAFTADEAGSSFECQLDGIGYHPCTSAGSGTSFFNLPNGSHTIDVRATDPAGNIGSPASRTWTVDTTSSTSTTSGAVDPGGSVSTDPSGSGPVPAQPVTAMVTLPDGGTAELTIAATTTATPPGFAIYGQQFDITAPDGTVEAPLVLGFRIDRALIPAGTDFTSITMLRNGVPVANCADLSGVADPDPCVLARTVFGDGDVILTVLSSHASVWNVAAHPPPPVPPTTSTTPSGGPTAQASTGARAAALKKCKKKHRAARAKCIKKAKKLPV